MDNKNLIIAVILSVGILVGFQYLYVKPQQEKYKEQVLAEKVVEQTKAANPEAFSKLRPRDEAVKATSRIAIETSELRGSINLQGARIDDLVLAQYKKTVDDASPNITLLSPAGSEQPHNAYYAEFSWLSDANVPVPTTKTEWKSTSKKLSVDQPLKLTWDNGQGLLFERTIAVDDHFMFTVTDRVQNKNASPVTLYPFGLIARQSTPKTEGMFILHEGPLGVFGGTLEEFSYEKLIEDGQKTTTSEGGWLGITDKYWLVALVPQQNETIAATVAYNAAPGIQHGQGHFQTDFRGNPITIEANASAEHVTRLFAGAKRLRLLDTYGDQYQIPHFDRAIDFGWFYFLTKPFLYMLDYMGIWFGSFGIAILVFTVILKLLTLPLSLKSYHSMARMKALQPEMKKIQERFPDDKMRQSQEMMAFYQREKINPMSGCVPMIVQIPIFFALYKVLYVGIELRQAPFYGWIKDMSMPDPTSLFTLFGLIPIDLPVALHIGLWPLLMGISMFLQQKLSPQPPDKFQARMFMFMPIIFTYMLAQMPSGLVIYWTWSNLLSILQQWYIMRQDAKKNPVV